MIGRQHRRRVFRHIWASLCDYVAMFLYHFTNAWLGIITGGAINPTFSLWDDGTLPLVHFTTSTYIESLPDTLQNRRYRITVEVDDAREWQAWARANLTAAAATVLTSPRFGGDPRLWMVVDRDVLQDEWVDVHTRIGLEWLRIWSSA